MKTVKAQLRYSPPPAVATANSASGDADRDPEGDGEGEEEERDELEDDGEVEREPVMAVTPSYSARNSSVVKRGYVDDEDSADEASGSGAKRLRVDMKEEARRVDISASA